MAVPQGGFNWNTSTLGQFLQSASNMTVEELRASMADLRRALQMEIPILAAVEAPYVSGPDAAGGPATGNPILVGGISGGNVQRLSVTSGGVAWTRAFGLDDSGLDRSLLADRAGVLAVAPPVSKLWAQFSTAAPAATALALTQPAPGAALRQVVLYLAVDIACAATAQGPITITFGTEAASIACPANDTRRWLMNGPMLFPANTPVGLSTPAPVAGAIVTGCMIGYTASLP